MALPLKPPLVPQLAKSRKTLPEGDEWVYEPKYDGFRALAFVDRDADDDLVYLQSRGGKPLARYFPELEFPEGRYVLDGELVILDENGDEVFDALQSRIHPADSRIALLSEEIPTIYRAFDLLALGDEDMTGRPFSERRAALVELVSGFEGAEKGGPGGWQVGSIELTPLTLKAEATAGWLEHGEGVIAKELDAHYEPGKRQGMAKIKRLRTIDAVVAGWRPGKEPSTVGSLMLGLYDDDGELHVVGHTSGLKAAEKRALVDELAPYASGERGSADPSRWDSKRELEWVALRPELVVEVTYDHVSAGRIRHGAKILRWRDDKPADSCTLEQLS